MIDEHVLAEVLHALKKARVQAVKLEGGADQADVISGLATAGIPVMAHVGLRPQNVHQVDITNSAASV